MTGASGVLEFLVPNWPEAKNLPDLLTVRALTSIS